MARAGSHIGGTTVDMAKLEVLLDEEPGRDAIRLPLRAGDILLDRLLEHGIEVAHDCGGSLACASCCIMVREGAESLNTMSADEQDMLDRASASAPGSRLACQAIAGTGSVTIEIPRLPPATPAAAAGHAVVLTERAAQHFAIQLAKRNSGLTVRLGVQPSGCSGFSYRIDYAETPGTDDLVVDTRGIRVAIDRRSLPFIQGTTVDLVRHRLEQRLRFDNPNARDSCGCGASFAT